MDKGLVTIGAMARECHRLSNLFLQAQGAGLEEVCSFFLGLVNNQAQLIVSTACRIDCRPSLLDDICRLADVIDSHAYTAWEEGQAHRPASTTARTAMLAVRATAAQLWDIV